MSMVVFTKENTMKECTYCGHTLQSKLSNFCSQYCFDQWIDSLQLPLLAVERIIRAMKNTKIKPNSIFSMWG